MVVPIMENVAGSTASKSKRYVGNSLTVNLTENNSRVTVIGNECKIKIESNNGTLKIIGNGCHVQVSTGNGTINYNGNCGRIRLGPGVEEKKVTYVGNEGKIIKGSTETAVPKKNKEDGNGGNKKAKPAEKSQERSRRYSTGYSVNIVNKSHKHYFLRDGIRTVTLPSIIVVPSVSESVIRITRSQK